MDHPTIATMPSTMRYRFKMFGGKVFFMVVVLTVVISWGMVKRLALSNLTSVFLDSSLEASSTSQFSMSRTDNSNKFKYVFKIVQITDLHLGEAPSTDWGKKQDTASYQVISSILHNEGPVDLVVLGGDQLTANDIVGNNATAYYKDLLKALWNAEHQVHWAMIFGNHDDAPIEYSDGSTSPATTSRHDLIQLDTSFAGSLTKGSANYAITLSLPNKHQMKAVARLLFFDSGGGSLPIRITEPQTQWLSRISRDGLPSVAFQHVPTQEFVHREGCVGMKDDVTSPLESDAGMVKTLLETTNVHFLAVGHNHGNDYCCPMTLGGTAPLHLCYGRHSGYGGYGNWDRGARVYQLEVNPDGSDFAWKSWVRLESGNIVDVYDPNVGTTV